MKDRTRYRYLKILDLDQPSFTLLFKIVMLATYFMVNTVLNHSNTPCLIQHFPQNVLQDISDDRDVEDADANVDYEDDIEMRSKPTRKSTMSSGDDEVDLEVIEVKEKERTNSDNPLGF